MMSARAALPPAMPTPRITMNRGTRRMKKAIRVDHDTTSPENDTILIAPRTQSLVDAKGTTTP